jgi:hypothetical protein
MSPRHPERSIQLHTLSLILVKVLLHPQLLTSERLVIFHLQHAAGTCRQTGGLGRVAPTTYKGWFCLVWRLSIPDSSHSPQIKGLGSFKVEA